MRSKGRIRVVPRPLTKSYTSVSCRTGAGQKKTFSHNENDDPKAAAVLADTKMDFGFGRETDLVGQLGLVGERVADGGLQDFHEYVFGFLHDVLLVVNSKGFGKGG